MTGRWNDHYEVLAADPLDSGARDLPSSSWGPSLVVAAVVRRFGRIIIIIVGAQLPFQIVRWHHSEQVHAHD